MYIIKKDGTHEDYQPEKIKRASTLSAERKMVTLSEEDKDLIVSKVEEKLKKLGLEAVPIAVMHNVVESSLEEFNPEVAESYRNYRNNYHKKENMSNNTKIKNKRIL